MGSLLNLEVLDLHHVVLQKHCMLQGMHAQHIEAHIDCELQLLAMSCQQTLPSKLHRTKRATATTTRRLHSSTCQCIISRQLVQQVSAAEAASLLE